MSNTFFQFKQFRVEQGQCAMKVCTDACVLGAAAPAGGATRILDIGTGTGLLSLMLAQRNPQALVEGVEMDEQAAGQALQNFLSSPWANRLTLHRCMLQHFVPPAAERYDLIICNPPFFINSLRPTLHAERLAKHTDSLSFTEILFFAHQHLQPQGKLCVMLPPQEQVYFAQLAATANLQPLHRLHLHDRPGGRELRTISTYMAATATQAADEALMIKEENGDYSQPFRELLKDFYLAF